jgi:hypothetical protein
MKIKIDYATKTGTIKNAFNKMFPYLKIEFFTRPHAPGEATPLNNMVKENIPVGELNRFMKETTIHISENDHVAAVEQHFQQDLGLSVQIFRKHKEVWIETTKSDQLSLAQQNEKGREYTMPELHEEPGDRYLEDGQY